MGIIRAIGQAIGGTLADQWLEVIEADDMSDKTVFTSGVLIRKGQNTKGTATQFPMVRSSMFMTISS